MAAHEFACVLRAMTLTRLADSAPFPLPRLLDERSRPDFRDVYGWLLPRSTRLDVALTRIRLSTLDLGRGELDGVRSIRLLLAEVNAVQLDAEAHGVMLREEKREVLHALSARLSQGIIEVRSAPLGGWSPDYSIFHDMHGPAAVLIGSHWFERPFPHRGPAFASLHGPEPATEALRRFEEAWERAHDIGLAVLGILERAERAERLVAQGPTARSALI
jgi:hypothetical protein